MLLSALLVARAGAQDVATATVTLTSPLHVVDPAFLGVNIDGASFSNKIDITDPYLRLMASQLSAAGGGGPMHLRIGGSAANGLVYLPNAGPNPGRGGSGVTQIISDASLALLNEFALAASFQITLCLSYQTRNGRWDPAINATALWTHIRAQNLTAFTGWCVGVAGAFAVCCEVWQGRAELVAAAPSASTC